MLLKRYDFINANAEVTKTWYLRITQSSANLQSGVRKTGFYTVSDKILILFDYR